MSTLFFDLDGTLADPFEGVTRSILHALERLGIAAPPAADLGAFIGPPLRATFRKLLATEDHDEVERAIALYRERYAGHGLEENLLYPGVRELCARVVELGFRVFVVTSKPRVYATQILEALELAPFFGHIYGSELDGRFEDKPDLLAHALAEVGARKEAACMIGDRSFDVRAAKQNGVRAVGVTWGYGSAAELSEAGADVLCAHPSEVAVWVEKNIARLG